MWNCPACGCQSIARDLGFCPMCFKEREDMPKITTGGATNAWDESPETAPEAAQETAQDAEATTSAPAPDPAPAPAGAPSDALSELEALAASLKSAPKPAGQE